LITIIPKITLNYCASFTFSAYFCCSAGGRIPQDRDWAPYRKTRKQKSKSLPKQRYSFSSNYPDWL
jgi:hypothetical protein